MSMAIMKHLLRKKNETEENVYVRRTICKQI